MNDLLFSFPLLSGSTSTCQLSPQLSQRLYFFFLSTFIIIVIKSLGVFGPPLVVGHLDEMCDSPSDVLVEGGHSVSHGNTFSTSTSVPIVESWALIVSKERGPVWFLLSPPEWVTEMFVQGFWSTGHSRLGSNLKETLKGFFIFTVFFHCRM